MLMSARLKNLFLVIILSVFFAKNTKAQEFADVSYYLIDSLNVDALDESDRYMLDSLLAIYHSSEEDSAKVGILNKITNNVMNDKVWPRYNDLSMRQAFSRMFSKSLSKDQQKYYAGIYASGVGNVGYYEDQRGNTPLALEYYFASLDVKNTMV